MCYKSELRMLFATNKNDIGHKTKYEKINYCKHVDLILDTHVGSASSLIACEDMGFKYVACELDKEYYTMSMDRLSKHLAQGKLFDNAEK